jgi:hypothetical protein
LQHELHVEAGILGVSRTQGYVFEIAEDCEVAVTVHEQAPSEFLVPHRPTVLLDMQ